MITKRVITVRDFLLAVMVIIMLSIFLGVMLSEIWQESKDYPATGTVRSVGVYGETHGLRDFTSTDELRQWLAQDNTDSSIALKANKEGIINFEDICEQYALQLQNHALSDGFKMSFAIMNRIDYYNKFRKWLPAGTSHALNLVIIGNDVYLVEPQSDEFWQVAVLD